MLAAGIQWEREEEEEEEGGQEEVEEVGKW